METTACKYIVVDEPADGCSWDYWTKICDTAGAANGAAAEQWANLTTSEQRHRHIYAGLVKREGLPEYAFDEDTGEIDWAAACNIWDFPSAFDSDTSALIFQSPPPRGKGRKEKKMNVRTSKKQAKRFLAGCLSCGIRFEKSVYTTDGAGAYEAFAVLPTRVARRVEDLTSAGEYGRLDTPLFLGSLDFYSLEWCGAPGWGDQWEQAVRERFSRGPKPRPVRPCARPRRRRRAATAK